MFFALCLLTAACADAEKPPKGAVTLIYMIGDGLGLAQVSMPVIGGGYVPKAFDRAQGAALIRTRRPTTACRTPLRRDGQHRTGPADHGAARTRRLTVRRGFVPQPEFRLQFFFVYLRDCATFVFATVSRSLCGRRELKGNTVRIGNNSRCCVPGFLD